MDLSRDQIETAARRIAGQVIETPVLPMTSARWAGHLPEGAHVTLKLELFQQTGSFKARGALLGVLGLDEAARSAGVVAASGGNHALAVSWAAKAAGVSALICMPEATDPLRVDGCRALGAEVRLCADIASAFAEMEAAAEQGRTMLHPFEAPHMLLGSATCGMEFATQAPEAEVFVIPVGGGGLIAGMAAAIKAMNPAAQVIGVEPEGADSLSRSLAAGRPVAIERVQTIADSLGAPRAMPLSFEVAAAHVDQMIRIPDSAMLEGMGLYRDALRLIAEPACAAALAALTGPLKSELKGRKIGIIACGSNISPQRYDALLSRTNLEP